MSITLTCALQDVPAGEVVMSDVLFGDVIGCHGQSNMQFGLSNDMNASATCAEAIKYPHIRTLGANSRADWAIPSNSTVCLPGALPGGGWSFQEFSAVCWYTGRALFEKLQGKVPIGLVAAEVGGTPVETWSGPDARKHCDQTQVVDRVGTLWTSMIVPLLDMKMSAQIWYQGENNVAAPFGGGCCIIGCPLRPSPPRTPGANGCRESCKASAKKCADFYGCQVFDRMISFVPQILLAQQKISISHTRARSPSFCTVPCDDHRLACEVERRCERQHHGETDRPAAVCFCSARAVHRPADD